MHQLTECAGFLRGQISKLENSRHGGTQRAPGTPEGADLLRRTSIRTRVLILASEFTGKRKEPDELRAMLAAFAPSQEEQCKVARAAGTMSKVKLKDVPSP